MRLFRVKVGGELVEARAERIAFLPETGVIVLEVDGSAVASFKEWDYITSDEEV